MNGDLVRSWGKGQYSGYKIPGKISLKLYLLSFLMMRFFKKYLFLFIY